MSWLGLMAQALTQARAGQAAGEGIGTSETLNRQAAERHNAEADYWKSNADLMRQQALNNAHDAEVARQRLAELKNTPGNIEEAAAAAERGRLSAQKKAGKAINPERATSEPTDIKIMNSPQYRDELKRQRMTIIRGNPTKYPGAVDPSQSLESVDPKDETTARIRARKAISGASPPQTTAEKLQALRALGFGEDSTASSSGTSGPP